MLILLDQQKYLIALTNLFLLDDSTPLAPPVAQIRTFHLLMGAARRNEGLQ